LALMFAPIELNVKEEDRQRIIGQLTNAVLNSLQPEQRKAYLLQPQQFFNLKTMVETILNADGVTPEMLQAEQAKIDLIQRLMETTDDLALTALISANDANIDLTSFQIISSMLTGAAADRQRVEYDRLVHIRDRMLELTVVGQKLKQQQIALSAFTSNPTRENLLVQLDQAPDAETRQALLTMGRPLLDYPFFQAWTAKIDQAVKAGNQAEADRLTALRKEILSLRDQIDAATQAAVEAKANFLRELLMTPEKELEAEIRKRLPEVDDLFFEMLTQNLTAAQQKNDQGAMQRLQVIGSVATRAIQDLQPPEVRFVNALLQSEYPAQTRELLEHNKQALVPELIEWMQQLAGDLRQDGRTEAADRLLKIIDQAIELAGIKIQTAAA
ncbi:MAG TPA: hypothetical protein VFK30_01665, partial [Anaerolineae bacterium]|nr:hypothetical protein [Anaerolineae bacterium]